MEGSCKNYLLNKSRHRSVISHYFISTIRTYSRDLSHCLLYQYSL